MDQDFMALLEHELALTIGVESPDGLLTIFRYVLEPGNHGVIRVVRNGQHANELWKVEMSPGVRYIGRSTLYKRTRSGAYYLYTGVPPPCLKPHGQYQYSSDATVIMIGVFNPNAEHPLQRWNDAVPGLYYIEQGDSSLQIAQPGEWFYRTMDFVKTLTQGEIDRMYGIDTNVGVLTLPLDEM
jgi:hypothetical protein